MHRAGPRRLGLAVTLATGAAMLGAAVHGMTGLDTELQLAAAESTARPAFVADRPAPHARGHDAVWERRRHCDALHRPHRRV